MTNACVIPNNEEIESVIISMTGNSPVSIKRLPTGDQNYVFAVKTIDSEYVLRMTTLQNKFKFKSAILWQQMLLPLGVPLAKFIHTDIDGKLSPYSSLLMLRLPGNDLINVYQSLTDIEKKKLAKEIVRIQALCDNLPQGKGFGILNSYEDTNFSNTWYDFVLNRLNFCKQAIDRVGIFHSSHALKALELLKELRSNFNSVIARPFLWDASERNVLVKNGKITGIVDVDDICFGDPLLVIALTSTCLQLEGYDTKYTDYWVANLKLDCNSIERLNFYSLFYAVSFMGKQGTTTTNQKQIQFENEKLYAIYERAAARLS